MKNIYLLKDLASKSGHSTHTIKFYLKFGLLEETGRSPATNFRYFDNSTVEQLSKVRKLRKEGRSIKAIKRILNLDQTEL